MKELEKYLEGLKEVLRRSKITVKTEIEYSRSYWNGRIRAQEEVIEELESIVNEMNNDL